MWIDRSNSQPTIHFLVHCALFLQAKHRSDCCLLELHPLPTNYEIHTTELSITRACQPLW